MDGRCSLSVTQNKKKKRPVFKNRKAYKPGPNQQFTISRPRLAASLTQDMKNKRDR